MVIKIFRNHGIYMVHEFESHFFKEKKTFGLHFKFLTRLVALSALGCKAHMCVGGGEVDGWMLE